jgi:transcription elongation factor GreA
MSETNKKPGTEPISEQGLADLRAEIEQLETKGRQEMAARIKAARELGDLKENAEYHIAKDDQAHLETKIKRLRFQLQNAEVVETDTDAETFAFGRTAEIRDEQSGELNSWTLVGATEADLASGKISVEAPIGAALRDAPVGQSISIRTPRGEKSYRVERLEP